jgi:hypothetical protein
MPETAGRVSLTASTARIVASTVAVNRISLLSTSIRLARQRVNVTLTVPKRHPRAK